MIRDIIMKRIKKSGWEDWAIIVEVLKEVKEGKIPLAIGVYTIKNFISSELLKQKEEVLSYFREEVFCLKCSRYFENIKRHALEELEK